MSPRQKKHAGGRPSLPVELRRVTLTCRVTQETKYWLMQYKNDFNKGIGELIDIAIDNLKEHPNLKSLLTSINEHTTD